MSRRFDHVDLRVRRLSDVREFYETLLPALGFTRDAKVRGWLQYARESADGVSESFGVTESAQHVANKSRIAFWAESTQEVDRLAMIAVQSGACNVEGPKYDDVNYYAVFFEDPSGNRLEICYREKVKPIPDGFHTVTPVLTVQEAAKLIDFLREAFDAKETYRLDGPNGTVMHAELKIGDSMVMVGEATDQWKPMPATVALYVEDTDGWYQRALRAGATSVREPSNQFYGDRSAGVIDFSGNHWWIHTHIEDVPPEEIKKRAGVWMKQQEGC